MILRTLYGITGLMSLYNLCHGTAWAHANAGIDSIDVIRGMDSSRVGLETTVGYLRSSDGESFEWNCHEAVTQPDALITPRYVENGEGVVLVTVGDLVQARESEESVYRTEDGCNWNPPDGLTGHQVVDVAFDPTNGMNVLAVTGNDEGNNRVYRSEDAGLSWAETDLVVENRVFRTLRFSKGSAGSVWLTAVRYDTEEAWVYQSTDGGRSWVENEIEVLSADGLDVYVDVLVADSEDANTAWVVMGPYVDDRLLKTTDGGASFSEVYALNGDIIDGAQDADGGVWLVTTGNYVVYAPDGASFERIDDAPLSIGIEADATQVMVATRVAGEGTAMAVTEDGRGFEAVDVFAATTGPPVCLPESDSVLTCVPLWTELSDIISVEADEGGADTADLLDTADPKSAVADTGCCSGDAKHSSVGLVFLTLLGTGFRRRKVDED